MTESPEIVPDLRIFFKRVVSAECGILLLRVVCYRYGHLMFLLLRELLLLGPRSF